MIDPKQGEPSPRAGRRRAVIVSLLALSALAAACVTIWRSIGEDVTRALAASAAVKAPAPPEKKKAGADEIGTPGRPIGEEELAFWSDVAIYRSGPGRPRPIVVVRRGKQSTEWDAIGFYGGLLARELVRQGLMLTAREELGALVRDVPIGDPELAGKPDATCRIGSRFRRSLQATPEDPAVGRITIVTGDGASRRVLWSREFDCDMVIAPYYGRLVMQVERFARGGFRKVLEGLGLPRPAPGPKNTTEGKLPEGVEERLGRLVETEQFAAIRTLHEAIRARGETSALLIGLARTYATLGSLTESQWTADYLAFAARSLLYAQRAVVRDQNAPASLRGQAYAEALAGLYQEARHDFEAADKADGGKAVPPWSRAAQAYAYSDTPALAKLAEDRPDDPLPLYLRFITLARTSFVINQERIVCRGEVINAGRALLAQVPDCYRVHDGMAQTEGVSNLHSATTVGLEQFATAVPRRLAAVPGLPASIAEWIGRGAVDEVDLRKRLVAAANDDPADLSWGTLARQFREIRFLQVCRRLHFIAYNLAASPSSTAEAVLPLVADHPNRLYVVYFARGADDQGIVALFKSLDLIDMERKEEIMIFPLKTIDPKLHMDFVRRCTTHTSLGTVPGQEIETFIQGDNCAKEAHNLLKYDPESPLGRAALIASNWDEARPQAEAWAKDHGGSDTIVIALLGMHWLKEKKYDEAVRLLEQALARSPDGWIFDALAQAYRATGQTERWIKAVDAYLKTEDLALDHAHATDTLAQYLLNAGEFEKARPYAELSASSGAGWAMNGAARCAERMKDWETAERWIARTAQRYANSWLDWFFWCKRTGHGDARAAAALIEAQLAAGRPPSSDEEATKVAIVFMLDERPSDARSILEPLFTAKHNPPDGLFLALASDQAGDAAARNAVMKAMAEDPKPRGPKTAKLVGILLEWLGKGDKSQPDFERINAILSEMPTSRPNSEAIVGILLDRHGQRAAAVDYLKRANVKESGFLFRLLAMEALRSRGIEPGLYPW